MACEKHMLHEGKGLACAEMIVRCVLQCAGSPHPTRRRSSGTPHCGSQCTGVRGGALRCPTPAAVGRCRARRAGAQRVASAALPRAPGRGPSPSRAGPEPAALARISLRARRQTTPSSAFGALARAREPASAWTSVTGGRVRFLLGGRPRPRDHAVRTLMPADGLALTPVAWAARGAAGARAQHVLAPGAAAGRADGAQRAPGLWQRGLGRDRRAQAYRVAARTAARVGAHLQLRHKAGRRSDPGGHRGRQQQGGRPRPPRRHAAQPRTGRGWGEVGARRRWRRR